MSGDIQVVGLPRLLVTLKAAARRVRTMDKAGRETATFVAGRARAGAPHRTGKLAASIRSSSSADGPEFTAATAYARRVHWGYRAYGQAGQAFIGQAVWANQPLIERTYVAELDDIAGSVKGA